ncbi:hypothetical protein AB4037_30280 [Labrys sp. KB_33_2]|uniref:hypothetical protein n=1 Tax=Labrys sp. KB_33_2 TaxID=3237479 RepID=UPI003F932873
MLVSPFGDTNDFPWFDRLLFALDPAPANLAILAHRVPHDPAYQPHADRIGRKGIHLQLAGKHKITFSLHMPKKWIYETFVNTNSLI